MLVEIGLYVSAGVILLVLIWTVWQIQKLQQQLHAYNDYAGEVRQETVDSVLSEDFLTQLRNHAQLQLTNTVKGMDQQLQKALQQSYQKMLQDVEQEAARIINGELEQYRQTIAEARQSATNVAQEAEKQLLESKKSIQEDAEAAVREEKQKLLERIDTKLSDVVVNYLVEAMGEHVDLGSQKDYIISQLEAHKEDIKQDVNDEF